MLPGRKQEEELRGQCPGLGFFESLLPEWGLLEGECVEMLQLGGNATSIGIYSLSKGPTPSLPQQETSADAVAHRAVLATAGSSKAYLSGR